MPLWLGKDSLCVLVLVVAKAGSALAASIAADAAMTESRRSMDTVYLRVVFAGEPKVAASPGHNNKAHGNRSGGSGDRAGLFPAARFARDGLAVRDRGIGTAVPPDNGGREGADVPAQPGPRGGHDHRRAGR